MKSDLLCDLISAFLFCSAKRQDLSHVLMVTALGSSLKINNLR